MRSELIVPENVARKFGLLKRTRAWKDAYAHHLTRMVLAKIAAEIEHMCDLADERLVVMTHDMGLV